MKPKVSLIASAVRTPLYNDFLGSLKGTSVDYEVVFAGNKPPTEDPPFPCDFTYIETSNIKPAQCYEVARRFSRGETVLWCADDCEFPNDVVGKAYKYWKSQKNDKLILSIQTKESGYRLPKGALFPMEKHRLLSTDPNSPLMAPLALMSSGFLDKLGGFDRKYICGQYENLVVLMAMEQGGHVEIFGDATCYIDIDHYGKSIKIGECTSQEDFLNRPFASGYMNDRAALLKSAYNWTYKPRAFKQDEQIYITTFFTEEALLRHEEKFVHKITDFEPYEEKNLLVRSQGPKGKWI